MLVVLARCLLLVFAASIAFCDLPTARAQATPVALDWPDDRFESNDDLDPWDESTTELSTPQWYGLQTLSVTLGSAVAVTLGLAIDNEILTTAGVIGYYAGPPLVHVAHGRPAYGFASLLSHLFMGPVLASITFVGAVIIEGDDDCLFVCDPHAAGAVATAFGLGTLSAVVIDTLYLTREPGSTWSVAPRLAHDAERTTAGVQLRF